VVFKATYFKQLASEFKKVQFVFAGIPQKPRQKQIFKILLVGFSFMAIFDAKKTTIERQSRKIHSK
jgi:hypothetical protein